MLRLLRYLFRLILLLAVGLGIWQYQAYQRFLDTPVTLSGAETLFVVQPGERLRDVARHLDQEGILSSPLYWRLMARISSSEQGLKVGEYALSLGLKPATLLSLLSSGKVKQYAFNIIEGTTVDQLLDKLIHDDRLQHRISPPDHSVLLRRLQLDADHLEGQFLPDTYFFTRGDSDLDILRRSARAMQQALNAAWKERATKLPWKTPYDVLTLASIVEKETALAEERPKIAGVFTRRIQRGMRLETDPTVIYGLGKAFKGNLKRRHLRDKKNPYNTYRIKGLPPTPICLPGKAALQAVAHPDDGKSLYFVATGKGGHYFSNSYREHRRAVRRYQLKKH